MRAKAVEKEEEYYLLLCPQIILGHPPLIHAHPFHVLLMLVPGQCLRQDIYNHFCGRNIGQFDESILAGLSTEVVSNVNVLGLIVVLRVL
jgi:hypothetical protein